MGTFPSVPPPPLPPRSSTQTLICPTHSRLVPRTAVGQDGTSISPPFPRDRESGTDLRLCHCAWGRATGSSPSSGCPGSGGGANLRGCPSLPPPPSGPLRLPWPRARPGKALFCQREPSECAEKSHPALMRVHTALQRGGGLPGGRGRGARAGAAGRRVRRPRGPGVPACLAANRTLSAVMEAGGSWRPSPAPATRRVTRKHGAAPLPRPPSPRSRLPPRTSSRPRGFCSSNALLSGLEPLR